MKAELGIGGKNGFRLLVGQADVFGVGAKIDEMAGSSLLRLLQVARAASTQVFLRNAETVVDRSQV